MNNQTEQPIMIAFDPAIINEIKSELLATREIMAATQKMISNYEQYGKLPKWLEASTAVKMECIPFTTVTSLHTWESRGVIRSRPYSSNGRRKLYQKEDCINFLDRRDAWKKGTLAA